jgi:hypothetical protein
LYRNVVSAQRNDLRKTLRSIHFTSRGHKHDRDYRNRDAAKEFAIPFSGERKKTRLQTGLSNKNGTAHRLY